MEGVRIRWEAEGKVEEGEDTVKNREERRGGQEYGGNQYRAQGSKDNVY